PGPRSRRTNPERSLLRRGPGRVLRRGQRVLLQRAGPAGSRLSRGLRPTQRVLPARAAGAPRAAASGASRVPRGAWERFARRPILDTRPMAKSVVVATAGECAYNRATFFGPSGSSPMSYSKIPAGKDLPNDIYVAIEIPANHAPIKYEIDHDTDCLMVDRFMATPMFYPANY